ncbi:methyltransferase domain-containing protein [Desulfovibrio aminophilus]|jgi:predicted SAM-dependent methyltransferase|nr:methyltransferase domain-containing protein [Desulfovibrio aminophilus]MCM0753974.1 methyltransferase domain-containing protein [Desulfovibrio aminophilus]
MARMLNLGCGRRFHPDWVNVDFRSSGPGVLACDLSRGLCFADQSFDVVYHSHVLEHFPKPQAPGFLRECLRVLRPGGVLRCAVPDLETIARLYLRLLEGASAGDSTSRERYEWIMLELLDQMVRERSGGEMLAHWKREPMPAEDFVIERVGSEVRRALAAVRAAKRAAPAAWTRPTAAEIGAFRLSGEAHHWMYDRYSLARLLEEAGFKEPRVRRADESAIPGFNAFLLDIEADGSTRKPDSLFMEAFRP